MSLKFQKHLWKQQHVKNAVVTNDANHDAKTATHETKDENDLGDENEFFYNVQSLFP